MQTYRTYVTVQQTSKNCKGGMKNSADTDVLYEKGRIAIGGYLVPEK